MLTLSPTELERVKSSGKEISQDQNQAPAKEVDFEVRTGQENCPVPSAESNCSTQHNSANLTQVNQKEWIDAFYRVQNMPNTALKCNLQNIMCNIVNICNQLNGRE